jgi:hypothetical protein
VSADAGRPVRRARVTIASAGLSNTVETDDQGAFEFVKLPAGDFTLRVTKPGYVETIFGQRQPGSGRPGTPIRLAPGQRLADVKVPLARGSVITGGVFDETGEPFYGARVTAYRFAWTAGGRALQVAGAASADDRGIYRIPLLPPGEYVVAVNATSTIVLDRDTPYFEVIRDLQAGSPMVVRMVGNDTSPPAPASGFVTTFHPGVTDATAATTVTIGASEERAGVDVHLRPVPFGRVTGSVTGPDGPVSGATVVLLGAAQLPGLQPRQVRTAADGRFSFAGVGPGTYELQARALPKGAKPLDASGREAAEFLATVEEGRRAQVSAAMTNAAQLWARAEIVHDGRPELEANLQLEHGLSIQGQVVLDPLPSASVALNRMSVSLAIAGAPTAATRLNEPLPAPVQADGRFTLRGVTPGRYTLRVVSGAPAGYALHTVILGGRDVLDFPIEIRGDDQIAPVVVTLSTRASELSGVVRDASGEPATAATVLVYPTDERFWSAGARRIQAVRPATDGRYVFRNLPPGDYRLATIDDVEPGAWFDPGLLRSLRGFVSVTVTQGGKHTQDLAGGSR